MEGLIYTSSKQWIGPPHPSLFFRSFGRPWCRGLGLGVEVTVPSVDRLFDNTGEDIIPTPTKSLWYWKRTKRIISENWIVSKWKWIFFVSNANQPSSEQWNWMYFFQHIEAFNWSILGQLSRSLTMQLMKLWFQDTKRLQKASSISFTCWWKYSIYTVTETKHLESCFDKMEISKSSGFQYCLLFAATAFGMIFMICLRASSKLKYKVLFLKIPKLSSNLGWFGPRPTSNWIGPFSRLPTRPQWRGRRKGKASDRSTWETPLDDHRRHWKLIELQIGKKIYMGFSLGSDVTTHVQIFGCVQHLTQMTSSIH